MFKNLLVAVDLEHDAYIGGLLRIAADMTVAQGAKMHLLHVIPSAPAVVSQFLPKSYEKMASKKIEKDLTSLAATVDLAEGAVAISVRFGDVYHEILSYADKISTDLIIVASHKPNFGNYLLGTTAARIVRHATCSVFVARLAGVTDR
jgi:nucleotide-binding universal stress UspA family protein